MISASVDIIKLIPPTVDRHVSTVSIDTTLRRHHIASLHGPNSANHSAACMTLITALDTAGRYHPVFAVANPVLTNPVLSEHCSLKQRRCIDSTNMSNIIWPHVGELFGPPLSRCSPQSFNRLEPNSGRTIGAYCMIRITSLRRIIKLSTKGPYITKLVLL